MSGVPPDAYSGIASPKDWVLVKALYEQAARRPDVEWITMASGKRLTFGQAAEDAARVAGHLSSLGVQPGDKVAILLPTSLDFVRVWLGLSRLGAIAVFLNCELRGAFLAHQLGNSGVGLLITCGERAPAVLDLAPAERPDLAGLILVDGSDIGAEAGLAQPDWAWREAQPYAGPWPQARDIACIMYTSGTSGPAKGVLMPHAHCALYGIGTMQALQMTSDDRYYVVLPLHHANGLLMQLGSTLMCGATAFVRPRFSASAWLGDVQASGATVTNHLGVTAAYVVGQDATPGDADHRLRAICYSPNVRAVEAAFRERFGVRDIVSGFGMTEVNICIWGRLGQSRPGAAGWVYQDRFEVMIADPETDEPRPPGEVGEILVRPRTPFAFMAGYHDMPEKTAESWRNLWFHTGDAAVMSEDGLLTFVDRIKDCIRRRSENISAAQIEGVVCNLPGVAEVAAFAVPSDVPGGEDDIMLAIVARPGHVLVGEEIGAEAAILLPRFAEPRYVEILAELPKTATGKVQREVLRKRGRGQACDRQEGRASRELAVTADQTASAERRRSGAG